MLIVIYIFIHVNLGIVQRFQASFQDGNGFKAPAI